MRAIASSSKPFALSVARLMCGASIERAGALGVGLDRGDLLFGIAELVQRGVDRLIDDLEVAAAGELLELHQREVGLDAGRVAVHHQADGIVRDEAVGDVGDVRRNREIVGELLAAVLVGSDGVVEELERALRAAVVCGALEELATSRVRLMAPRCLAAELSIALARVRFAAGRVPRTASWEIDVVALRALPGFVERDRRSACASPMKPTLSTKRARVGQHCDAQYVERRIVPNRT